MQNKVITSIVAGIILTAILTGSAAIVKVNVLEERVKSQKELLIEINKDVKWLKQEIFKALVEK